MRLGSQMHKVHQWEQENLPGDLGGRHAEATEERNIKCRKQNVSKGFTECNTSSPWATCPTKNRGLTRDIWQDTNDPELRVQGEFFS